ncbi:hypothetical protein AAY84_10555 [Serratia marcescens]|nr:hypothetical protein AAY84_10555 [Serratia marcescens]
MGALLRQVLFFGQLSRGVEAENEGDERGFITQKVAMVHSVGVQLICDKNIHDSIIVLFLS